MTLLAAGAVALVGCADDRPSVGDHRPTCSSGVAIVLESFDARFGSALPVSLRACFDQDCDVVRIVKGERGIACAWDPGGPPAQLTTCTVRADGAVEIDIARVDGRSYADGARHVVATAVSGTDGVLYSHAEEVRLVTAGDSGCYVTGLDLRPLFFGPSGSAGRRFARSRARCTSVCRACPSLERRTSRTSRPRPISPS